jgi:hypothetical protein
MTRELRERYGSVIRISPNELDFCDPAAFLDIYNASFNGIKDPDFYNHPRVDSGTMLLVDGDPAQNKARFHPAATLFSSRKYEPHQANMAEKVELLSRLVSVPAESRTVYSLVAGYQLLTVGVMYDFVFSAVPGRFMALRGPDFGEPLTVAPADSLN